MNFVSPRVIFVTADVSVHVRQRRRRRRSEFSRLNPAVGDAPANVSKNARSEIARGQEVRGAEAAGKVSGI